MADYRETNNGKEAVHRMIDEEDHSIKESKKGGIWGCLRKKWVIAFLLLNVIVAYIVVIVLAKRDSDDSTNVTIVTTESIPAAEPRTRKITVVKGAVVSDHQLCSEFGRQMFTRGGSAVDATIATLLCDGIMAPHSMGIGGGLFMVVYDKKTGKAEYIDGRETGPSNLTSEQYQGTSGVHGGLYIGIPGEIKAYWTAHQKYGKLPWKDLFEPTIKLSRDGYHVSSSLARALRISSEAGVNFTSHGFCDIYCDENGKVLVEGDFTRSVKLSKTLRGIADFGPEYLYNSELTDVLVKEVNQAGGGWTRSDLTNYTAKTGPSYTVNVGDDTLHTLNAPSGGPVLGLILNILKGGGISRQKMTDNPAQVYHILTEAMKLAYADRKKLADPDYESSVKEVVRKMKSESYVKYLQSKLDPLRTHSLSYYTDSADYINEYGTAHVSVLGPEGDAVSVTSTVNMYFGSLVMSNSTGIIWNNELTDFALERAEQKDNLVYTDINAIKPGKRPLSSMAPAIFVDKSGNVRLVLGAAGGSRITTAIAQIAVRVLFLGEPIDEAIRSKRVHHQLLPETLFYEYGFPQDIVSKLESVYGHQTKRRETYMAVAEGISRDVDTGEIRAFADERKIPGKAKYFTQKIVVQDI